jgi:hypothetical protein
MNERIYNLIKQSEVSISSVRHFNGHIDINKFAELIVRECANVANQHMEHNEGTDYNVGGKIKQHFGVQE